MDGKELAKLFAEHVNSAHPDKFVIEMLNEHRTLQQNFMKVVVLYVRELAKLNENQYDLRNEDSVKLAKAIVERCSDELYLRYI